MRKYVEDINKIESIVCEDVNERETTISFSMKDNLMSIYTSDNTIMTKLKRCILDNPKEWVCWEGPRDVDGNITGYFLEAPKKYLTFRKNRVQMSEENRQKASERFSQMYKEGKLGKKTI